MRRIFFFTLSLIAILVACTGILLFRPSLWPQAAARIGATVAEAPRAADRDSPFAKAESQAALNRKPVVLAVATAQPEAAPPQTVIPLRAEYPFPTRADISLDTSKPDIVANFGPPQVSVTGADRGQLQERMIYTERTTGKKTVIAVVNGKVTSVETLTAAEGTQE
jgi:hypothetical protein